MDELANGDCEILTTLTYADGSSASSLYDGPDAIITKVDPTFTLSEPLWWEIGTTDTTGAGLTFMTSDIQKEGTYSLKLTVIDSKTLTQFEHLFDLVIIDNPCNGVWTNIPATNDLSQTYLPGSGDLDITLTGLTCTECAFTVDVYLLPTQSPVEFITVT